MRDSIAVLLGIIAFAITTNSFADHRKHTGTRGGYEHRAGAFYGNGPEYGVTGGARHRSWADRYDRQLNGTHHSIGGIAPAFRGGGSNANGTEPYGSNTPDNANDQRTNSGEARGNAPGMQHRWSDHRKGSNSNYNPYYHGHDEYRARSQRRQSAHAEKPRERRYRRHRANYDD